MADKKVTVTHLASGVPEDQIPAIRAASAGGQATVDYMARTYDVLQLFTNMNDGTSTWIESTTDDEAETPVMYLMAGNMSIVVSCAFPADATNAVSASAIGSAAQDGPNYHGYATITINSGNDSIWNSFAQVVAPIATTALALDLVRRFAKAMSKTVFKALAGDANVAALDALGAEEMAEGQFAEGAEFFGVEAEAGCFGPIAEVVIIAACVVIMFDHETFHHLTLNNLTDYDLRWDVSYQGYGSMRRAPGNSKTDKEPLHVLAAATAVGPPHIKPQRTFTAGSFDFQNDTTLGIGYYGVGYVMSLQFFAAKETTNPLYTASILFMIPYSGKNSLYCSFGDVTEPEDYFKAQEGRNQNEKIAITKFSADEAFKLSVTFDYLEGKHPLGPNGKHAYSYNSIATIEQVSLKVA